MKKAKNVVLRRFIAFAIDWNVIILACVGLFLLGPRFDIEYLLRPSIKMFSSYGVILGILGFVLLPLFKDCLFKGASLGKLVCGLKVYDSRTQNVAKIPSLIARNLTFYIPLVELIVFACNKGRTIGDMLSKSYADLKK